MRLVSKRELVVLGTSSQQHTRFRNHGGYLLWWNCEGMLFDPGEGMQRQLIFAEIAPTVITRIFISHFHGDHCLGLSSILLRLNLDKVTHPIHCYYPASGKRYFHHLRYSSIYRENIHIVEHPIEREGEVDESETFTFHAKFLRHTTPTLGWKVVEKDRRKFSKEKLDACGIKGVMVRQMQQEGSVIVGEGRISLEEVSWMQKGSIFAYLLDTVYCEQAIELAQGASLLLSESTFSKKEKRLAAKYFHLTTQQAALIAKKALVNKLVITHFSARYPKVSLLLAEAKEIFSNTFAAKEFAIFSIPKCTALDDESDL